jgi:endopolyphosphatase
MIPYLFLQGILVASVTALPVLEQQPLGLAIPESNSQSDGGIHLEKSRRLHGRFLHITGKIDSIGSRLRSVRGGSSKTPN